MARLWRSRGLACFVMGDVMDDEPSAEMMTRLRLLLSPGCWEIAVHLLQSPQSEVQLVGAGIGPEEGVRRYLSEMVEAGLLTLDRDGYKLFEHSGLPWAAVIKALANGFQNAHTSVYQNYNDTP